MNEAKTPLARYLEPPLDDARIERQLAAIGERAPQRSRAWRWSVAVVALGAVLAIAVVSLASRPASPPAAELARIETAAGGGQSITLADGSRLSLEAHSTLRVGKIDTNSIELTLDRGGVDCDVTPKPERRFVVHAGGYAVRVVGTRFAVRLAELEGKRRISVSVERGRVEVTAEQPGAPTRALGAGESWSAELGATPEGLARVPSAPAETAPEPAPPPPATSDPEGPELGEKADSKESSTAGGPRVETAKQLFERAARARAEGRLDEARQALQTLRTRYPNDARASVAAFELARLEQESGRDPKAAAKLLSEAIAKAPAGSPVREDAEARRVEALDRAGQRSECRAAREQFLARYPKSVHKTRVLKACAQP